MWRRLPSSPRAQPEPEWEPAWCSGTSGCPAFALGSSSVRRSPSRGAVCQGLFRNPLGDPGLVGGQRRRGARRESAPSCSAACCQPPLIGSVRGNWPSCPFAAFLGGWASVMVVSTRVSRAGAARSVATCFWPANRAGGTRRRGSRAYSLYIADDRQLRDLTFWGARLARRRDSWVEGPCRRPDHSPRRLALALSRPGALNGLAMW